MIGEPAPMSSGPPFRPRIVAARPYNGVKFGDHAAMKGYYVGLVVDVSADGETVMCASRNERGTMVEAAFRASSLHPVRPRR